MDERETKLQETWKRISIHFRAMGDSDDDKENLEIDMKLLSSVALAV